MKFKIIAACFSLFFFINQQSQAQAFETGTNMVSLGLGLGSYLGSYAYTSQTPGISAQFEHGQWSVGGPGVISLGGYLGFKGYTYEGAHPGYAYSQKWNYTVVGVRSAYHYNDIQNKYFDIYGGAMLAYNILNYTYTSSNPELDNLYKQGYNSGIGLSLYLGGRYFFTDELAVFAELGYGVSYFTVGGAFKF